MRHRVFFNCLLNIQYSHLPLLACASSCFFFSTAYSILTSSTLSMCVIVFFFSTTYSILTSSTLRLCVIVFFQLLAQYSHLRLLACASSCFFQLLAQRSILTSFWLLACASSCFFQLLAQCSILTSSTLSGCVIVFFSTAHSILTSSTLSMCVILFFQLLTQYSHLRLLACASSCFFNCSLNTHIFDS